ncbi:MAG: hypothetical protein WBL20_07825 [Sphingobium sp.]|uniref:hypothetical protein n=1 Tax=Sphingobium sp. TaxID=1912891 RepID=UPI003BAF21DE
MCDCISDIDSKLEEHSLDTAICFAGNALVARTYTSLRRKDNLRPETRSKKPRLFAHTFCPFCGERYDAESAAVLGDEQSGGQPA